MSDWVRVEDGLPLEEVDVIVHPSYDDGPIGYIRSGKWVRGKDLERNGDLLWDEIPIRATHWMPLPLPPKEMK